MLGAGYDVDVVEDCCGPAATPRTGPILLPVTFSVTPGAIPRRVHRPRSGPALASRSL